MIRLAKLGKSVYGLFNSRRHEHREKQNDTMTVFLHCLLPEQQTKVTELQGAVE